MAITIQLKRGVATNIPVLQSGELYYATDSKQMSVGPTPNKITTNVGSLNSTANAAAIAATTLFTPAVTGFYQISVRLKVTRAATTSCVLGGATGVVVGYTDGDDSVALTSTMALTTNTGTVAINSSVNATSTTLNGTYIIYAKTGVAVTLAVGYTTSGTTAMQYSMHATAQII